MKISIRNLQKKIPVNQAKIKKAILRVLSSEGKIKSGQITVCFVSDKKIKNLNLKYLKRNISTDVLAFDLSNRFQKEEIFADIIVSADTAVRNSFIFNTNPSHELKLYVIHGVLHILGYKDINRRQKSIMRSKEESYVNP